MMAGFLIWLAKILIQHFLGTQVELRKKLDESVKRNEDYEKNLAVLRKREVAFEQDIEAKRDYLTDLYYEIGRLNKTIEERNKEHADKLQQANERIDNLNDGDVVRGALPNG